VGVALEALAAGEQEPAAESARSTLLSSVPPFKRRLAPNRSPSTPSRRVRWKSFSMRSG
jgi:hypothetical protein